MKNILTYTPPTAAYFFILLFCYAAISKAVDFENFQVQIGQSPLLSAYAELVSFMVIIVEILIAILLIIPRTRFIGIYASTALMSAFTIYIYLILNYSDFVPCACGGILENLGWKEHLVFNISCILLGISSILCLIIKNKLLYRKHLIIIAAANILSMLLVTGLFLSSEYIIKKDNNFTRRFLLYPVTEDKRITLEHNYYYFAGEDQRYIYLGNKEFPQIITTVTKDFSQKTSFKIIPENLSLPFKSLILNVKDSHYYLSDGTIPVIFRGKLNDPHAKIISYQDAYFSQIAVVDSSNFILRSISSTHKQLTAALLSLNKNPKIQLLPDIIQKQKDGIFDSDGQLTSTKNPFRIIYLYNYRNQFTVTDKDFKIIQRLKTIDTVSIAQIKTKKLADGRHKMVAPPLKVNQNFSAVKNLAFIHSALMGNNESVSSWKSAKVIDMYRLDKQEYVGSFYLYNEGDQKMTDYLATQQYFFAIIGNKLVRYMYQKPIKPYLKTGEAENLIQE